jgi:ABC-type microcin C transport system duplicated ATPase subunit YejF
MNVGAFSSGQRRRVAFDRDDVILKPSFLESR